MDRIIIAILALVLIWAGLSLARLARALAETEISAAHLIRETQRQNPLTTGEPDLQ